MDRFHVLTLSLSAITLLHHFWARRPRRKVDEVKIGVNSFTEALRLCDKITDLVGPLDIPSQEGQVNFMSFKISHFASKAYVTVGNSFDSAVHMKLQTIFEDNRPNMSEEERYYIANEWNTTKRYTRCKYNSVCSSAYEPGTFTLEYDILLPGGMPHKVGVELLENTLAMWHTSAVACVLHIVNYKKATLPFATHGSIVGNTLEFQVADEDLMRQQCAICLEGFQKDEWVRRLPCLHVFHTCSDCNIDTHLVRDKQCPVCRTPIDVMDSMASVSKKQPPELARAVVHLQERFNEFHNLVSHMRDMLHQLRADCQNRADEQPQSSAVPPCEVFDAVAQEDSECASSSMGASPPTHSHASASRASPRGTPRASQSLTPSAAQLRQPLEHPSATRLGASASDSGIGASASASSSASRILLERSLASSSDLLDHVTEDIAALSDRALDATQELVAAAGLTGLTATSSNTACDTPSEIPCDTPCETDGEVPSRASPSGSVPKR